MRKSKPGEILLTEQHRYGERKESELGQRMERKAHNYTLEYRNWRFLLNESESGNSFFVSIYYKDNSCSMYVHTGAKTAEEAKERVENFIKDELK